MMTEDEERSRHEMGLRRRAGLAGLHLGMSVLGRKRGDDSLVAICSACKCGMPPVCWQGFVIAIFVGRLVG